MITTKRGDKGETDCGGERVYKDNLLVETIGEIDELQAVMCLTGSQISDFRSQINKITNDLGMIMGELGGNKISDVRSQMSGKQTIRFQISDFRFQIEKIEKEIEKNKIYLNNFVVFKKKKAKELNWARTICRRVERRVVALSKIQVIDKEILKYFNRLSDYLFTMALKNN